MHKETKEEEKEEMKSRVVWILKSDDDNFIYGVFWEKETGEQFIIQEKMEEQYEVGLLTLSRSSLYY